LTTHETQPANETSAGRNDIKALEGAPGRIRAALANLMSPGAAYVPLEEVSPNELAAIRTDLAVSRNLMGADRTLMAWIRTALSLNSFGFTIYKLLETFEASGGRLPQGHTPRNIGLFLTGMGTFAMVMGALGYRQEIVELRHLKTIRIGRPTIVMGILMAGMGIFLFFAIITKLF